MSLKWSARSDGDWDVDHGRFPPSSKPLQALIRLAVEHRSGALTRCCDDVQRSMHSASWTSVFFTAKVCVASRSIGQKLYREMVRSCGTDL